MAATIRSSTSKRFDALIEKDALLEYAEVFDNYYGTPAKPVMDALAAGRDVLFDIDWQGTNNYARRRAAIWSLYSFCRRRSPSWSSGCTSARRTITRPFTGRMAKAADEMSHWAEYDYVVINHDLDEAYADVKAVLAAERLKRERQPGLSDFVRGLTAKLSGAAGRIIRVPLIRTRAPIGAVRWT